MSDFRFEIVGDASRANRAVSDVEAGLRKIGASASAVSLKLKDALGGGSNAAASSTMLARRAVSELNDQLKRQDAILKAIHGPMDTHRADLAALQALYRMNKIDAKQYLDQLTRINNELSKSQGKTPAAAPSMIRRGAAALGVGVGVGVGVREVGALANEYQNLQNRLRFLAGGDQAKVNELFAETQRVARATRSDISATTEAFVRFSLATKDMGISQSETLALTERINKAIKLSGATTTEAAAGMIQLSQGLASGALRGDELRSVMEQLPAVADVIAKSLGVTRGQLRNMGAEGKITAEVIVEAFRKAGPELDKAFGNTVPTLSESLVQFKNDMTVAFGEVTKSTGIAYAFGGALHSVGTAVQGVTGFFKMLDAVTGDVGGKVVAAMAGIALAIRAGLGPLGLFIAGMEAAAWAGNKLAEITGASTIAERKRNEQLARAHEEFSASTRAVIAELDAMNQSIQSKKRLTDATQELTKEVASGKVTLGDLRDFALSAASAIGELTSAMDAGNGIIVEENKKLTDAVAKVDAYKGAIAALQVQLENFRKAGVADPTKLLTAGDVALVRAYQDAQEDAADLTLRYGGVLNDIHKRERDRRRGIEDLKLALAAGAITQAQYNEEIKKYLPHAKKQRDASNEIMKIVRAGAAEWDRQYEAMMRVRRLFEDTSGLKQQAETEREVLDVLREIESPLEKMEQRIAHLNSLLNRGVLSWSAHAAAVRQAKKEFEQPGQAKSHLFAGFSPDEINEKLDFDDPFKKAEKAATEAAARAGEAWGTALGGIGRSFIDMAREGEKSFAEMTQNMLRDIALLIARMTILKAIQGSVASGGMSAGTGGFLTGLTGALLGGGRNGFDYVSNSKPLQLPGFRTGGDAMIGGRGGPDTTLVAFWGTPGESYHVRTPQQRREAQAEYESLRAAASSGGRTTVVVQTMSDPREISRALGSYSAKRELVKLNREFDRRR